MTDVLDLETYSKKLTNCELDDPIIVCLVKKATEKELHVYLSSNTEATPLVIPKDKILEIKDFGPQFGGGLLHFNKEVPDKISPRWAAVVLSLDSQNWSDMMIRNILMTENTANHFQIDAKESNSNCACKQNSQNETSMEPSNTIAQCRWSWTSCFRGRQWKQYCCYGCSCDWTGCYCSWTCEIYLNWWRRC